MTSYTVYDPATGEILKTGHCPDEVVDRQAPVGMAVVRGVYAPDEFYTMDVDRKSPKAKTPDAPRFRPGNDRPGRRK